jgi:hypothetical protein
MRPSMRRRDGGADLDESAALLASIRSWKTSEGDTRLVPASNVNASEMRLTFRSVSSITAPSPLSA